MMYKNFKINSTFLILLTLVIDCFILYIDWLTPRGYLEWFAYLAPLLFFSSRLSKKNIILITIISSVFILIGFAISNPGLSSGVSFANRFIGIIVLSAATAIQIQRNNYRNELEKQIKEKEILIREIHHRVKNNFQMISSLLNLQLLGNNDPEITNLLKISKSHIQSMALMHEKLYKSKSLTQISSSEYIKEIIIDLFNTYNMKRLITLNMDVEDFPLNSSTALLLGLIINEAISNSFKYAFPDDRKGEINISLKHKDEENLYLLLKDNGIGFQNTVTKKKDSLGMELISSFTQQLEGKLEVKKENGVEICIIFPKDSSL